MADCETSLEEITAPAVPIQECKEQNDVLPLSIETMIVWYGMVRYQEQLLLLDGAMTKSPFNRGQDRDGFSLATLNE